MCMCVCEGMREVTGVCEGMREGVCEGMSEGVCVCVCVRG